MKNRILLLAFVLCLTALSLVSAPLDAALISSFETALPGETATFDVSLLNSGTNPEFLTGINFTLAGPPVVDDTRFFTLVPPMLAPGGSYVGPLFDVFVPAATPFGIYTGVIDIVGGATVSSQDLLARMEFGVQVVPEPATLFLIAPALAALALVRLRH